MIKNIGHYAKACIPLIIAGLTAVLGYFEDGMLSTVELQTIGALVVTALGVLAVPNTPKIKDHPPVQPVSDWPHGIGATTPGPRAADDDRIV